MKTRSGESVVCPIPLPLFHLGRILFALVWFGQLVLELDNLPEMYGPCPNIVKLLWLLWE
jgi:hypothetical protein